MAWVKTFRINPDFGLPDKDIRNWLTQCEEKAIISVVMQYIPKVGTADPRLTVIATKLDDLPEEIRRSEEDHEELMAVHREQ